MQLGLLHNLSIMQLQLRLLSGGLADARKGNLMLQRPRLTKSTSSVMQ